MIHVEAEAHSIVEQAQQANAADMPNLESSGWVQSNSAVVVIRNDSPEQLRITLRGPETRIEELDACSSCERFNLIGPLSCPGKGPVGRYTLEPGAYDVVVEAIGERGVTPFSGNWTLNGSRQYSSCFYIVTRPGL